MAEDTARVLRASRTATAGIQANEGFVALAGSKERFVVVSDKGTYIKGPVSFIAGAHDIRRGGLWVGLSDFLHMIPSTIVTPIPAQIPMPPAFLAADIARDVALFAAALG